MSSKSRCGQGRAPSEGTGGERILPASSGSCGPRSPQACGHITPVCLLLTQPLPVPLSLLGASGGSVWGQPAWAPSAALGPRPLSDLCPSAHAHTGGETFSVRGPGSCSQESICPSPRIWQEQQGSPSSPLCSQLCPCYGGGQAHGGTSYLQRCGAWCGWEWRGWANGLQALSSKLGPGPGPKLRLEAEGHGSKPVGWAERPGPQGTG